MNPADLIQQMDQHAQTVHSLAAQVSDDQARWKPDPQSWSILEVICHLYDEECLDFRVRLDIILHHNDQPVPPIDPQGWVTERAYNQQDLQEKLAGFLTERRASLEWLRSLGDADWDKVYTNPWGQMTAGEMFAAWAAHDLLHLRQLVELHWAYLQRLSLPYSGYYAGDW